MFFKINKADVLHEVFDDGGIVVINLKTGKYYNFSNTSLYIWHLIEKEFSDSQIIELIIHKYNIEPTKAKQSIAKFITELQQEYLLLEDSEQKENIENFNQEINNLKSSNKLDFTTPVLTIHTDMQDLLLLDPIHEVDDENGWPHIKKD